MTQERQEKKRAVVTSSRSIKRAQLVADAVAVLCPFCAEPQPNKQDGSEQWTVENFRLLQGSWTCVSCDERFMVSCDTKVQFL